MKTIDLTYKMIHFPELDRWVAIAWNYDEAALFSPGDRSNYLDAKDALKDLLMNKGFDEKKVFRLRWFDGVYEYNNENEQIFPKCL